MVHISLPQKHKNVRKFHILAVTEKVFSAVQAFINFVPKLFIPTLIYQPFSALYLEDLPEEHSEMKHLANFPRFYYEISSIFNSVKSKQVIVFPRSDSLCCQNHRPWTIEASESLLGPMGTWGLVFCSLGQLNVSGSSWMLHLNK